MSNQEMQFADPDWKPSQQFDTNNKPQDQEEYIPQPINSEYREQNKWGPAPSTPPQQEEYTGLRPNAGPVPGQMQGGNFRQRPYGRRGRGPWFWIILAFIVISLVSGGSHLGRDFGFGNGPGDYQNPLNLKQGMAQLFDFKVNGQATLVINDPNGNVTVTEGKSNADIIIQPVNENNVPGNPSSMQPNISRQGNTITANLPYSVDLQIIVPNGANLNLNTGSGTIDFNGTFDITGTDQFQTTSGDVNLTVPSNSAFHLDASTNSGSINSDFPDVKIQENPSGSGQTVNGLVDGSSQRQVPNVVIKSDSGDISLNQN